MAKIKLNNKKQPQARSQKMTTNVSLSFKVRDAISGYGKMLTALAIVMFAILPLNAHITISEAKHQLNMLW